MKILTKTAEKMVFAEEMDESLANAIRRSAIEVPILAIDEVEFTKNDSVLYDEVLALRLGLTPFKRPKDMNLREKCSCKGKGCAKCTAELKLSVKGPCTVYAKDFKGEIEPVHGDTVLVKLRDEQELELVATAVLGKGKYHTKFSPGLVYYQNVPEIQTEKGTANLAKCVSICPRKILKLDKDKLEFTDKYRCDMCDVCVEACEGVKVIPTKEILFTIESFGMIKAEDILIEAVKALKENLKEI